MRSGTGAYSTQGRRASRGMKAEVGARWCVCVHVCTLEGGERTISNLVPSHIKKETASGIGFHAGHHGYSKSLGTPQTTQS